MNGIVVEGKLYALKPAVTDWLEVEDAVGPLPVLLCTLRAGQWKLCDVVTALHILLSAARCDIDFARLGEEMALRGIAAYRNALEKHLSILLEPREPQS